MVPFGFSVGDFIAGINLLLDIVRTFDTTQGAQADYRELGEELINLRRVFEGLKDLDLDTPQSSKASAVNKILNDCQSCIDGFMKKNSKFQSLSDTSEKRWSLATLKRQGRKVQWALWKKADVARFRTTIQQHANALQLLLASIHM